MKKILLAIFTALCFMSCENGKDGPFTIYNSTKEKLTVQYIADGTEKFYEIDASSSVECEVDYYTPKVAIIKTEAEKEIISNKYCVRHNGFKIYLEESPVFEFSVNINIPEEYFEDGNALYFYEKNNLTEDWSSPVNEKKFEIAKETKSLLIQAYSRNVRFIAKSENDEKEFMLNGNKISLTKTATYEYMLK